VNFITAHDGFTLEDLVSYSEKHNEANGEENRDGGDDNASWNWGAEGPTDDAEVLQQRARLRRALLTTLVFSHGTPMLLGGDEFLRTQQGNNNAYCQDNALSWYDWSLAESAQGREQIDYVARLFALRRKHPSLRCAYFMHGHREVAPGLVDLIWFDESGTPMSSEDWDYAEGRLLAVRRAVVCEDGEIESSILLINGSGDARDFSLPPPQLRWRLLIDSANPARAEEAVETNDVAVAAHSIVLLLARMHSEPAPQANA
jgi:glycogen operon protein